MKHIYFVRHGETLANRKNIHQGPEEPLSLNGRKQAENVALYLRDQNIDTLVCSTFVRARETAEIIGKELNLPFMQIDSIKEFKRPHRLYNQGYYTLGSLLYIARLFIHRDNPSWNDDGAENMFAVRNRVVDAKTELAKLDGERIVAVSHAIFMDMFLELACMEKSLTVQQFIGSLLNLKKTPNTGIIHLLYDENVPSGMCPWQLIEIIDPRTPMTLR